VCACSHHQLQFTRNYEKYLHYNPDDVQQALEKFFDGGAK